ncbi:hypothetical protein [Ruminococcus flavefaciens]|uniref:hypothetical protein n=1 Tax=Ruminococcus flavefaciens TaxID=1265 RepID=UPI0026F077DB|nr:hypothetical protein [Ruminococcus flavefaciens]
MKEIYSLLPDIIIYIVLGFVFLKIYYFSSLKPFDQSLSDKLIESLLVGFVLKNIYDFFPSINHNVDIIAMILTTSLLGFLTAKLSTGKKAKKAFDILKIHQDGEKFIWRNLIGEKTMWATLTNNKDQTYYYGRVAMIESFERKPQILLTEYKYSKDGNTLNDYTNHPEQTILLDTSQFQDIRISYSDEDLITQSWTKNPSSAESPNINKKSKASKKPKKKNAKKKRR